MPVLLFLFPHYLEHLANGPGKEDHDARVHRMCAYVSVCVGKLVLCASSGRNSRVQLGKLLISENVDFRKKECLKRGS